MSARVFLPAGMVFLLVTLVWCRPAYAYIDAGTGGMILQMLAAGILGAALSIKIYWQRIKAFFAEWRNGKTDQEENDDA